MSQPQPSEALEVRRARPDEIAACADLYLKVLRETFTWVPAEGHRREEFLRSATAEEIYLARQRGELLGIAGFYRPQSFIHSLYVDARGLGVGSALLDHLRGVTDYPLSLKVQAPNAAAQVFYARQGFVCVERGRDPGADIPWLRLVDKRRP